MGMQGVAAVHVAVVVWLLTRATTKASMIACHIDHMQPVVEATLRPWFALICEHTSTCCLAVNASAISQSGVNGSIAQPASSTGNLTAPAGSSAASGTAGAGSSTGAGTTGAATNSSKEHTPQHVSLMTAAALLGLVVSLMYQ